MRVYGVLERVSTENHIRGDEGAVEDEGGDMDEPFPGFESLPPDTERQINRHRNGSSTCEENEEGKQFFGKHRKGNFKAWAV